VCHDLEHSDQLRDGGVVFWYVFQDFGRNDAVKCRIGVGQVQRIADNHFCRGRGGCLSGLGHRLEDGVHRLQFGCIAVERDHIGTAPIRFEGVPTSTAADVDHFGSRPDSQPIEIDCQHCASPSASTLRAIARS